MTQISQLLKRVYLFLEDGEFDKADEYCERILDEDPECAEAYLCKLCVDLKVHSPENLSKCIVDFESNKNYQKVLRFGDENIILKLNSHLTHAKQNVNNEIAKRKAKNEQQKLRLLDKNKKWIERRKVIVPFKSLIDEYNGIISGIDVDGNVIISGTGEFGVEVSRWTDMKAVCKGYGIKNDGSVIAKRKWEFSDGTTRDWRDIVEIAHNDNQCAGLRANGTVAVTTGRRANEYIDGAQLGHNIISICAGVHSFLALKNDGTVTAIHRDSNPHSKGSNCWVQDWKNIIEISSSYHTLGLKSDGTVVVTLGGPYVQDWKDIVSISAGQTHYVGLKRDGTVVATGDNCRGQCNVSHWKKVVAIKASNFKTIGLLEDGTVIMTGPEPNTIYNVPNMKLFDNYLTFEEERKKSKKKRFK